MTKTKQNAGHIPTPWAKDGPYPGAPKGEWPIYVPGIFAHCIAVAFAEQDRAFIVRAVNAHDALVSALEGMIALGVDDEDDMILQNAIAVLKLAKGA